MNGFIYYLKKKALATLVSGVYLAKTYVWLIPSN